MPIKSDIVSLGGVAIPTGVTGQIDVTSEDPNVSPEYQERIDGAAVYLAATRPATDLVAILKCSTYAYQAAALAWLGFPRNMEERTLRVYGGDPSSLTTVETPVTVVDVRVDPGQVTATLRRGDVTWKSTSTTTEGPTTFAAGGTTTFTVGGEVPVTPLIKVGWSVQRATSSSTNGWKYRKKIVVTNSSGQSLHNQVIQLGPWNTAALVTATKMRSDCRDAVVFNERGERLRGLLYGANSRGSFLTFVMDELVAGGTRTFDLAYGNPNASYDATSQGFPYTFSGSPTIDITAIDNVTGSASTTSSFVTGQTVDANRFNTATILITGSGTACGGQYRRVSSHTTGGTFTPTRNFTASCPSGTSYVIISGPFMGDGGQASATTSTSLTDSAQSWQTNEWIGATVESITLSTTMGTVGVSGTVTSNTATALTIGSWSGATPSGTTLYRVYTRNANYIYRVDQTQRTQTNHRGRWRTNRGNTKPSGVWFAADGAPHAWTPTIYNPQDAQNDFNQVRVTATDVGGSDIDYFAILNASIARKDGARLPAEGFANGCVLSVPLGILGMRMDYAIKNPAGMAKAVFGCRERGGEDWELYHEYSTTQATLTARPTNYYDLTAYGTPLHLLAAITSDDDADIAKTETLTANLTDNTVLEVRVDTRNLSVTEVEAATEESVYDMTLRIRRGAGASIAAGEDEIQIGADQKHLFIASGEKVWIGPIGDAPLAARIYSGSTWIRDCPWQVDLYHVDNDYRGTATRYVSADVLPLTPGSTTLRVIDNDGTQGSVTLETLYETRYM